MANRCPPGFQQYTIKSGDNFFRLALSFRTSVTAIIRANPGIDPNALRIGQQICIPRARVQSCPPNWIRYAVKAGDTLFKIARQQQTTVSALLANNPDIAPNSLRIGQVLCVPPRAEPVPLPFPCPEGLRHYTIRTGDTLSEIAARRGTSVRTILRFNPSLDPNSLRVGQIICVP
jgi:LysM repeat protein